MEKSIPTVEKRPELAAFDLGERLAEMLMLGEMAWVSSTKYDDPEAELRRLRGAAVVIGSELKELLGDAPEVRTFHTSFRALHEALISQWNSTPRVGALEDIDPEFRYDYEREQIADSPFSGPVFAAFRDAVEAAIKKLSTPQRLSLELGAALTVDKYPAFIHLLAEPARGRDEDEGFWITSLTPQVRKALVALEESLPVVAELEFMQRQDLVLNCVGDIGRLRNEIRKAIEDPAKYPRYLGLVLDKPRRVVGRWDKEVRVAERLWGWLERLVQARGEPVDGEYTHRSTDGKAVSDLRKVIRPLKVKIDRIKKVGWLLKDCKVPSLDR